MSDTHFSRRYIYDKHNFSCLQMSNIVRIFFKKKTLVDPWAKSLLSTLYLPYTCEPASKYNVTYDKYFSTLFD